MILVHAQVQEREKIDTYYFDMLVEINTVENSFWGTLNFSPSSVKKLAEKFGYLIGLKNLTFKVASDFDESNKKNHYSKESVEEYVVSLLKRLYGDSTQITISYF